ncbi:MAG: ABC transporter permease, partial [Rhodomicrobium sp.]
MRAGRLLIVAAALLAATAANAQTQVKIGVLNDRSGLYADPTGEGSV